MLELDIRPDFERTNRQIYVADRPVDFDSWLEVAQELDTELLQGVILERMAAQYPHEWILVWFTTILNGFVRGRRMGCVLTSRMPVKISEYTGRLPDIVFVRQGNIEIIRKDAIYGVPDLVIEILSENDRLYRVVPLESDYRQLGVPEIVFVDPRKQRVRQLNKAGDEYDEQIITTGSLSLRTVPGFTIQAEWLFADDKPVEPDVMNDLLEKAKAQTKP
jgi:Uma2 family endonuclease